MLSDDQQNHVQAVDTPLSVADIIRDIANVEAASSAANGPLSDRLMAEIYEVVRGAVSLPWMAGETGGIPVIRHVDWTSKTNVTLADSWLEISEIGADAERSWIACATGTGSRMGFELKFRPGLPHFPAIYSAGSSSGKRSEELGFLPTDGDGSAIFLPVDLERETLAVAFSSNNFAEALAPVAAAVEQIVAAKDELDRLIGLVRKRGKTG